MMRRQKGKTYFYRQDKDRSTLDHEIRMDEEKLRALA